MGRRMKAGTSSGVRPARARSRLALCLLVLLGVTLAAVAMAASAGAHKTHSHPYNRGFHPGVIIHEWDAQGTRTSSYSTDSNGGCPSAHTSGAANLSFAWSSQAKGNPPTNHGA